MLTVEALAAPEVASKHSSYSASCPCTGVHSNLAVAFESTCSVYVSAAPAGSAPWDTPTATGAATL